MIERERPIFCKGGNKTCPRWANEVAFPASFFPVATIVLFSLSPFLSFPSFPNL